MTNPIHATLNLPPKQYLHTSFILMHHTKTNILALYMIMYPYINSHQLLLEIIKRLFMHFKDFQTSNHAYHISPTTNIQINITLHKLNRMVNKSKNAVLQKLRTLGKLVVPSAQK